MIKTLVLIPSVLLHMTGLVLAESKPHQPYAGQEQPSVSSLAAADLNALKKGQGWGLANPAELNGYPGPIHVLKLVERLELIKAQISQVRAIYTKTNANARHISKAFVNSEVEPDALFKTGAATPDAIQRALKKSLQFRAELRAAHLNTHNKTVQRLTQHQRHLDSQLRRYSHKGAHSGLAH